MHKLLGRAICKAQLVRRFWRAHFGAVPTNLVLLLEALLREWIGAQDPIELLLTWRSAKLGLVLNSMRGEQRFCDARTNRPNTNVVSSLPFAQSINKSHGAAMSLIPRGGEGAWPAVSGRINGEEFELNAKTA